MLANIRRVIIKERKSWLEEFFMEEEGLKDKVKETPEIESKREKYINTRDRMIDCKRIISQYKNYANSSF